MVDNETYDPDVEGRLYAEIYYSNDTYPDKTMDGDNILNNPEHSAVNTKNSTNSHRNQLNPSDPRPEESVIINSRKQPPISLTYTKKTGFFPKKSRALIDGFSPPFSRRVLDHRKSSPPTINHRFFNFENEHDANSLVTSSSRSEPVTNSFNERLMRKNDRERRRVRNRKKKKTTEAKNNLQKEHESRIENSVTIDEESIEIIENIQNNLDNEANPDNPNNLKDNQDNIEKTSQEREKSSVIEKDNGIPQDNSKDNLEDTSTGNSEDNALDNETNVDKNAEEIETNLTKYDVVEKCARDKMTLDDSREDDSDNSSDTDESIFEIPVPPKPVPPLIDIQDSDESSSSDDESVVMSGKKLSSVELSDDEDDDSSDRSQTDDSDSHDDNNRETSSDSDNEDDEIIVEDNIILNCTQVKRGVSCLEEIKKMRDGAIENSLTDNNENDDNSEENQMNSKQMGNCENHEKSSGDVSRSEIDNDPKERNNSVINDENSLLTPQNNLLDGNSEGNNDKNSMESRKRSRQNQTELEVVETQELSPSQKKFKNGIKSTAEMTFTEYIFQPMPKHLETYYNNHRGGEFLDDVWKIQQRMPRNPNRWAILDADTVGINLNNKGKKCSMCLRTGHKQRYCPEKPKTVTCHMCGIKGHRESRCPRKMCLTCGKRYSTYRKVCEYCRTLRCTMCQCSGHEYVNCPDLWRRYHHSTSDKNLNIPENPLKVLKPTNELHCCNCAKRGHDSSNCTKYQWSQHFLTNRHVTSYTKPPFYEEIQLNAELAKSHEQFAQWNDAMATDHPIDKPSPTKAKKSKKSKLKDNGKQNKECEILYHYTNSLPNMDMNNWVQEILIPKSMKGVSYKYIKSSLAVPKFLEVHLPQESGCYFDITFVRYPKKRLDIILKALNTEILNGIKKLVIQWLTRNIVDRGYLKIVPCLSIKAKDLFATLKRKYRKFVNSTSLTALKFHEKIKIMMKELSGNIKHPEKLVKQTSNLLQLKKEFISSAYNLMLAPSAIEILMEFQFLMDQLPNYNNSYTPSSIYMSAVWFNFELFTPYFSRTIRNAVIHYFSLKENDAERRENNQLQLFCTPQLFKQKYENVSTKNNTNIIQDTGTSEVQYPSNPPQIDLRPKNTNLRKNPNPMYWQCPPTNEMDFGDLLNQLNTAVIQIQEKNFKNLIPRATKLLQNAQSFNLHREDVLRLWSLIELETRRRVRKKSRQNHGVIRSTKCQ